MLLYLTLLSVVLKDLKTAASKGWNKCVALAGCIAAGAPLFLRGSLLTNKIYFI